MTALKRGELLDIDNVVIKLVGPKKINVGQLYVM
jgi:hypothetical protein